MSRITGSDSLNLMEAYYSIYSQDALTEEQIWEEVELWVNELVEEGYDLSDYTWDELYENYIVEFGNPSPENQRTNQAIGNFFRGLITPPGPRRPERGNPPANTRVRQAAFGVPRGSSEYQSRFARPRNAGTPQTYGGGRSPGGVRTDRPAIGSLPPSARQVTQYPQGVSTGVGGGNAGASRTAPSAATRPAPAASRPAPAASRPAPAASRPALAASRPALAASRSAPTAPAIAAPAAPSGATKPAPTVSATPTAAARPAPTPISQQLVDLRKMRMASQMRQAGQNVVSTQLASFDPFDAIVGHLINEGYADTYEDALNIMANMSDDWKENILSEEEYNQGLLFKKQKPGRGPYDPQNFRNSNRTPFVATEKLPSTRQSTELKQLELSPQKLYPGKGSIPQEKTNSPTSAQPRERGGALATSDYDRKRLEQIAAQRRAAREAQQAAKATQSTALTTTQSNPSSQASKSGTRSPQPYRIIPNKNATKLGKVGKIAGKLGRFAGKAIGPLSAASDVYDEKSKGSGWARSLAKGATVAAGGALGGAAGVIGGGGVGSLALGAAGALGGAEAAGRAFDTVAGANAKERAAMRVANRRRQAGSSLSGIGGPTHFGKKGNNYFMSTGVGKQRKTVQLAKTGVVNRGNQSTAGYLAFKGGKATYKAAPNPQTLAKTSSNPLERIGRTFFAGAYKKHDAQTRARALATARAASVARNKKLGIK